MFHNNKKRILLYTSLTILLIVISYASYTIYQIYNAADKSYQNLERSHNISAKRIEPVTISDNPISILLIGVENYSSDGQHGRADTQIVVTLNPNNNKLTMTSIPRDTRVKVNQLEQYTGFHKINATYTFGSITGYGANKLTVETVENLLDIPIDKFISVDFEGFRAVVDALGGVTLDIKEGFWEKNIYDNNNRIYFEKGVDHLNGEEALAFVRMRKRAVNATYPREERQRQFIKASIDEIISTKTIFKVGRISEIIGENVETNLKPTEIYELQTAFSSMNSVNMETLTLNGKQQIINGLYYFTPEKESKEELSNRLRTELELPITNSSSEKMINSSTKND